MRRLFKVRCALVAVASCLAVFAADGLGADRAVAPADSAVKAIEREVAASKVKLQSLRPELDRYDQLLKDKGKKRKEEEAKSKDRKREADKAERSWNGRNPRCTSGLTYEQCKCHPGSFEKKRMEFQRNEAKAKSDAAERQVKRTQDEIARLEKQKERCLDDIKVLTNKLWADSERLKDTRKHSDDPPSRPSDELPLKKPTKPGAVPDELPLKKSTKPGMTSDVLPLGGKR